MLAVTTAGAGKAVRKDAAFQMFEKRFAGIRLGHVVVALPIELAGAGQIKPGLEMHGYRLVEQLAPRVARVVGPLLVHPRVDASALDG